MRLDHAHPVVIAGAGPVGLLLANLLGQRGHHVVLLEARTEPHRRSMAIGITPLSLDILAEAGLVEAVLREGLRITRAVVHENGVRMGTLDFAGLPGAYPYVISFPQTDTENLLQEGLRRFGTVELRRGCAVEEVDVDPQGVSCAVREASTGRVRQVRGSYLMACDGAHSTVRRGLGSECPVKSYRPTFTMLDTLDTTQLGADAHLFFSSERPVESFPLPGGRRRWIVRTGWREASDLRESMDRVICRLTGHAIDPTAVLDQSWFHPRRYLLRNFVARERVVFCGDAAHGLSPIGGQGMNTGFGDAAFLARALEHVVGCGEPAERWFSAYNRRRRQAFEQAAARAALGMALGTMTGSMGSGARRLVITSILSQPWLHHRAALWFSMRSLPHPLAQVAAGCTSTAARLRRQTA